MTLPRPRDQVATKELPEFQHLRAHVWRLVKRPDETVPDDLAEAVAEDEAAEAQAEAGASV